MNRPILSPEDWATDPDKWLPNHPIYSQEQWQNIKAAVWPLENGIKFSSFCAQLIMIAGGYQANSIRERPVEGYRIRSKENQYELKNDLKAIHKAQECLTTKKRGAIQWYSRCSQVLAHSEMRGLLSDLGPNLNQYVPDTIQFLKENGKDGNVKRALEVLRAVEGILIERIENTKRQGRPKSAARAELIKRLSELWKTGKTGNSIKGTGAGTYTAPVSDEIGRFRRIARAYKTSVYTDRITNEIGGEFVTFVSHVMKPICEENPADLRGLEAAIKKAVYPPKESSAKKKGVSAPVKIQAK